MNKHKNEGIITTICTLIKNNIGSFEKIWFILEFHKLYDTLDRELRYNMSPREFSLKLCSILDVPSVRVRKDGVQRAGIKMSIREMQERVDIITNGRTAKKSSVKKPKIIIVYGSIYLLAGKDINTGKIYYKLGRTERHAAKRLREYGYTTRIVLVRSVVGSKNVEAKLLELLRLQPKIITKGDLGNEYFECNSEALITNFVSDYITSLGWQDENCDSAI
jgi:hypothetical protein